MASERMPAMSFHIRNEGDLPMQSFPRLRREDTRGDGGDFSRRGATNVADVPSVAAAAPARLVRRARAALPRASPEETVARARAPPSLLRVRVRRAPRSGSPREDRRRRRSRVRPDLGLARLQACSPRAREPPLHSPDGRQPANPVNRSCNNVRHLHPLTVPPLTPHPPITPVSMPSRRASGRAAASLASARGASVIGLDANPNAAPLAADTRFASTPGATLRTILGPHPNAAFTTADVVVLSPGVLLSSPQIRELLREDSERKKPEVLSELAFASTGLPSSLPVCAVTGTNGKSTVCVFLGTFLEQCGATPFVGGNLGTPLSELALAFVTRGDDASDGTASPLPDVAVVECSSYQLEHPGISSLRFDVACALNLTPDHLERHGNLDAYAAAKARIFTALRSCSGRDHPPVAAFPVAPRYDRLRGAGGAPDDDAATRLDLAVRAALPGDALEVSLGALPGVTCDAVNKRATLRLPFGDGAGRDEIMDLSALPASCVGTHNVCNAAHAAALARLVDPERCTIPALERAAGRLEPPPHRMTAVATPLGIDPANVRWIDDSKATNVEAAAVGLDGLFADGTRAVVLLGGVAKEGVGAGGLGLGFERLASALAKHHGFVCFGASGREIARELRDAGLEPAAICDTMEEAAETAHGIASGVAEAAGRVVVLSPACASFDEFRNYRHRGEAFAALARKDRRSR